MPIAAVSLDKLEEVFCEMDSLGVKYGLGAKAPYLDIEPGKIKKIDCSGFTRYAIYKATNGKLVIPDGSQAQREWCEKAKLKKLTNYSDVMDGNKRSLYVAFIKPWTNGCQSVGHVWFVTKLDGDNVPDTMESHGGVGVDSRRWDYLTLNRQVYSCYEVPVV
ncbi:MAG: hypothetical protein RLY71_3027 [Pseudomonadota bacterium]|jgi:hypothetical protein